MMHRTYSKHLVGTIVASLIGLAALGAFAEPLAEQTSSAGGVTLRATPRDLSTVSKTWEFEIVLETHSQDLADDLATAATLVTDGGAKQAPTAWDGDPPGGHHRKGVLRFAPVVPQPEVIELRVVRAGEDAPRFFRWRLK